MKIDYVDNKERDYVESGDFAKRLKEGRCKIVEDGGLYWFGFKVTDEVKANAFVYDLIAAMNGRGDPKTRIDTDSIGIKLTEFGLENHTDRASQEIIKGCIRKLADLVDPDF